MERLWPSTSRSVKESGPKLSEISLCNQCTQCYGTSKKLYKDIDTLLKSSDSPIQTYMHLYDLNPYLSDNCHHPSLRWDAYFIIYLHVFCSVYMYGLAITDLYKNYGSWILTSTVNFSLTGKTIHLCPNSIDIYRY